MNSILLDYQTTVDILSPFKQQLVSGGINTPPEARMLMLALVMLTDAQDVLETGYDAGHTTFALAMSGKNITAIDNGSEYPGVKDYAKNLLKSRSNTTMLTGDALAFMCNAPDNSFDFIFVDDNHAVSHVALETDQVVRILRSGGLVAYHDVNINGIGEMVDSKLVGWRNLGRLRCWSEFNNSNFGIGIYQKPTV